MKRIIVTLIFPASNSCPALLKRNFGQKVTTYNKNVYYHYMLKLMVIPLF